MRSEDGTHICRRRIRRVLHAIRTSDVVLFGGGNLLQNQTSRRSLLLYAALLLYAKRHGRRTVMISTGLGELSGGWATGLVRHLLRSVDGVFVRTEGDEAEARALIAPATSPPVFRTADICFFGRERPSAEVFRARRVFLILRGDGDDHTCLAALSLMDRLRRAGYAPALLVLFPSQDYALSYRLSHIAHVPLLTVDSYEAFAAHTLGGELVITERLHGAIFSLLCHIPCYLCTKSVKCRRLVDEVRQRAHTASVICPLFAYRELSELYRRLFPARDKQGIRPRALRLRLSLARYGAVRPSTPHREKKEVGTLSDSDFRTLLRSLRTGARWDRFVFYEDM